MPNAKEKAAGVSAAPAAVARPKRICVVGAGYVGGPTGAVLAKMCPDVEVYVVDIDKRRVDAWNSDNLPLYEPNLLETVKACRHKNLHFSNSVEEYIDKFGYDLTAYEAVSRTIALASTSSKVVVEKSTVPVRTAEKIREVFGLMNPNVSFEVISNPEFLAEGTAIKNLLHPERVIIGGLSTASGQRAVSMLASLYRPWVPEERLILTGLWSAELAKLACNAFLAQRVSSINSMSAICEATGADVSEVAQVLGSDSRIGPKFLRASVGFGGSCFPKDLQGLIYLCEGLHLPEVAAYWQSVLDMNQWQKRRFAQKVVLSMFGTVRRKDIAILGFSFKKDTGDIRESAAIDICRLLTEEGANLFVYDPKVPPQEIKELFPKAVVANSAVAAAQTTHALVVLTEWDEFKSLDYKRIYETMQRPSFVFDGRNILDHAKLREIGFIVHSVGRRMERRFDA